MKFAKTFISKVGNLSTSKKIGLGAVLLIILIVVISGGKPQGEEKVHDVSSYNIIQKVVLSGRTENIGRADLAFGVSGRIAKVNIEPGDVVKKGQILAELDAGSVKARVSENSAALALVREDFNATDAQTNLDLAIAEQEKVVESARRALLNNDLQAYPVRETSTITPPTITGAYSVTEEGEYYIDTYSAGGSAGFAYQVSGLENFRDSGTEGVEVSLGERGLFIEFEEGGFYANTDWVIPVPNKRSSTYITVLNAYEEAKARRDRLVQEAQDNFEIRAGGSTTAGTARIDQAQARLSAAYAELGDYRIRAPFDGVVAKVDLSIGDQATAFESVAVITTEEGYKVDIRVPELDLPKVNDEARVAVSLDVYPGEEFEGQLVSIDTVETFVEGVPVYEAVVEITQQDDRIRAGLSADVHIISQEREVEVAIPQEYIQYDEENEEQAFVMHRSDEESETQRVDIILGDSSDDGFVEVVEPQNFEWFQVVTIQEEERRGR